MSDNRKSANIITIQVRPSRLTFSAALMAIDVAKTLVLVDSANLSIVSIGLGWWPANMATILPPVVTVVMNPASNQITNNIRWFNIDGSSFDPFWANPWYIVQNEAYFESCLNWPFFETRVIFTYSNWRLPELDIYLAYLPEMSSNNWRRITKDLHETHSLPRLVR